MHLTPSCHRTKGQMERQGSWHTGVEAVKALQSWALTSCAVCLSTSHEDHLQWHPSRQPPRRP